VPELTANQQLEFLRGRLVGLSGTARYDIPDALRDELKQLANDITSLSTQEVSTND
jgi:hypothetical protein